jgi:diaminopimelate epimerase
VVLVRDLDSVDVTGRGKELRHHPSLTRGANVNFLTGSPQSGWRYRTYERGVEAETLACGTGAVACAVLARAWGLGGEVTPLLTRSGKTLTVSCRHAGSKILPSLRGEGRIVFVGELAEI